MIIVFNMDILVMLIIQFYLYNIHFIASLFNTNLYINILVII